MRDTADKMATIDWNGHLQEHSLRQVIVNRRSYQDALPGIVDIGTYCQKKPRQTTAESPKMERELEGHTGRSHSSVAAVRLSLKFQWKILLL